MTYETQLPRGYTEVFTVDAEDKKTSLRLNLAAVVLFLLVFVPFAVSSFDGIIDVLDSGESTRFLLFLGMYLVLTVGYLVLHELTHGAVYAAETHRRLRFGFKGSVAYCGVPDIWVYRGTALRSLLAPFIVFLLLFGTLSFALSGFSALLMQLMLAMHISGCAGDLYDAYLYFTKFREPTVLMRDFGPKQVFYKIQ